ncbi:integrator complex assembly factor WDR73 [Stegastes partitus]|uniref:WD repeat domain 73 n=1 Tax=Stegastes partitus TaxID=144197 RepID=A0A3B4ZQ99_9TELE|nr:PREDICTED: WD repeat-containing protein 73 [Stegastes partitus]
MEDTEFDDILDDWFIESLKTYKDLHVYQLEHPTQVIEWTSGKTVCVAGYSLSKNEILELRLPLKLFADENKGLCAERDFKVAHGGFSDRPVRCLKHIPGTRCVVTNDGLSSNLQVWDLGGDDCDVIRRTGSVAGRRTVSERGSRVAARLSSPPQVLHGAQSSDVQLTELNSGRALYKLETDSADPLSSLHFVSDTVFLAGCCNGSVYIGDTRTSAAPQLSPPPASSGDSDLWWTDTSAGQHPSNCRVVRLSSSGRAVVSDLRSLGGAVCQAQLDVQARCCNLDDVSVSWAPTISDCISVSGFSGVVQIYNTCGWSTELQERQPLFQHRGHVVSSQQTDDSIPVFTTAHSWHPELPRTLLSAASDGSVHVWDWVDPEQSAADSPTSRTE